MIAGPDIPGTSVSSSSAAWNPPGAEIVTSISAPDDCTSNKSVAALPGVALAAMANASVAAIFRSVIESSATWKCRPDSVRKSRTVAAYSGVAGV